MRCLSGKGYFSSVCFLLKWVDHPWWCPLFNSLDTLNLAKYLQYFVLLICSISWDPAAGRYFPAKDSHQLRATPDTHWLMDRAFVLVKWSFIRIVIKYLNMKHEHFISRFTEQTSETRNITYSVHIHIPLTVGKFKWNHNNNNSKLVILSSFPSAFGLWCLQFITAIEIIHQLYCPAQII